MDYCKPAMSSLHAGDKRVRMCVVVGLPYGSKEEGCHEKAKRRHPRTERMSNNLKSSAEEEHGSEVEILAQMRVGECGKDPASKGRSISGTKDILSARGPEIHRQCKRGERNRNLHAGNNGGVDIVVAYHVGDDGTHAAVIDSGDKERKAGAHYFECGGPAQVEARARTRMVITIIVASSPTNILRWQVGRRGSGLFPLRRAAELVHILLLELRSRCRCRHSHTRIWKAATWNEKLTMKMDERDPGH